MTMTGQMYRGSQHQGQMKSWAICALRGHYHRRDGHINRANAGKAYKVFPKSIKDLGVQFLFEFPKEIKKCVI